MKEQKKQPIYVDKDNEQYNKGFEACKRLVLKILEKDWTGLDMSINSCDEWYINQIKEL